MLRAIILSLVLFVAFGTLVPIATEFSEASVKTQQRKYKKKKRAKKYRRMARKQRAKRRRARNRSRVRKARARRAAARKRARSRSRAKARRRYRSRQSARARSARAKRARARRARAKRARARKARARRASVRRARARKARARKARATRRKSARRRAVAKRTRRPVRRKRAVRKKRPVRSKRTVRRKRVRKYSKKWWASRRAQQRRRNAVAARKRSMRLRAIRLAKKKDADTTAASTRYSRINTTPNPVRTRVRASEAPVQQVATGDVSIEVVGAATGQTVTKGRNTLLGGVSTTTLRRTVIDQMIRDSGWVENDYHKEIGGKKVYVVVAKAPDANNAVQSRTYYFAESNGRIYRVATRSSQGSTESAQKRTEEAIRSLDGAARPQQAQNQ